MKKKKQVKDELDRIKQAEKKKRRLEKALATSAAIISELEKKKQMKKEEEQQRMDDEGAAIAEAVALHVLIDEDSNDTCVTIPRHSYNQQLYGSPSEEFGWIMSARGGSRFQWSGNSENGSFMRSFQGPCVDDVAAAGQFAALGVSRLHIADDEDVCLYL